MNVKNLLAGLGAVALAAVVMMNSIGGVKASINDPEFDAALSWMHDNGLTKYNNQNDFMPYATLTREQFAKFAAAYGLTNLCLEVDSGADCAFSDIPADPTLGNYVTLACQLGLVKGSDGKYFPTAAVKKSEVLTVMSRAISAADGEDAPSESMTPWWKGHFDAMKTLGVTKETDVYAVDRPVTRYEVALMLYRSRVEDSTCSDVDLSQLLEDLFGPTDSTPDEAVTSDANVMAELSSDTPDGQKIPGLVSIHVASFDFTAEGDDAVLDSLTIERMGLGDSDVLKNATIFVNNEPVTKSRSFNSDDQVNFSLNPKVDLPKGKTVTIDVVVKVADKVNVGQEFSIALVDFSTNGTDKTNNLPVEGNEFEVAGVNGATVTVTDDGSVSDVELGEKAAEVAKFKIENETDDQVFVTQVTIEDDEKNADEDLTNFMLTHDGTTIASTANTNGKYLTFVLDDPMMIGDNESESFKVLADVIAGAGDQIGFLLDQEIYVMGYDDNFGYGLNVNANWIAPQQFAINAGAVTFVEQKLKPSNIRADRKDVELAKFNVNINQGQDLSLEDILFTVDAPGFGGSGFLDTYFENVQLVVMIGNAKHTYDLNITNPTPSSFDAGDSDLGIFLPDRAQDVSVSLIADTIGTFDTGAIGEEFHASLDVANDVNIIENSDDQDVDDIVPSSISFDNLTFVNTTIDVNSINLSDVSVVIGAQNVDAVLFEVATDDVSSALAQGFTFATSGTIIPVDQQVISALRLWMETDDGWELLEQKSGFKLNGQVITFDNFTDVVIPDSSEQLFLLTVDVIDNDALDGNSFRFWLTSSDIEDDDNTQLCVPAICNANSTRIISINGAGDLDVSVDTDMQEVNIPQYVLGGESQSAAPFVASFELNADNEGAVIEDITIIASGAGATQFEQAITEVVLYDDDMTTVLDSKTVTSTQVNFNNINWEIPEGSTHLWVKVIADTIGNQYEGVTTDDITLILQLANVNGAESGDDISPNYDDTGHTLESNPFSVVDVKFSDADFVLSSNGYVVDTSITNGNDINLAILQLTADARSNTQNSPVGALELIVNQLVLETSNTSDVTNYEIKRVGNGTTSWIPGTLNITGATVTFDLSTGVLATKEFTTSEVGYYVVRADVNAGSSNTSIKMTFDNLNGGSPAPISYTNSDLMPAYTYTELRIGDEQVESSNVSITNA